MTAELGSYRRRPAWRFWIWLVYDSGRQRRKERARAGAKQTARAPHRYVGTGPSVLRVNTIACAT